MWPTLYWLLMMAKNTQKKHWYIIPKKSKQLQTVLIKTRYSLGLFCYPGKPLIEEYSQRLLEAFDLPGDHVVSIEYIPTIDCYWVLGDGSEILIQTTTYQEALANLI